MLVTLFGIMVLCAIPLAASATSYQVIGTAPISWEAAHAAALALPGNWDLVSITSLAEQTAVDAAIAAYFASISSTPENRNEFWIGGFRSGASWGQWVSGEPWSYTNWWSTEPNNASGNNENHIAEDWRLPPLGPAGGAWAWNDEGSDLTLIKGYVAESVPEPTTMLLLGFGLIGLAVTRMREKH